MMITKDAPSTQGSSTDLLEVVLLADAGWFAAPDEPGLERFWSGTAWSDDRRTVGAAPASAPRGGLIGVIARVVARRASRSTEVSAFRA